MTSVDQLSARKQRKLQVAWRSQHGSKRVHASKFRAWLTVARVHRDDLRRGNFRRSDIWLRPYECRWGADWRNGASYPAHWHIGHAGRRHSRYRRWLRRCRRCTVYPWRRTVSRVRIAFRTRSLARHSGWHKSARRQHGT